MKITSANITGSFIINGTDVTNTLTTSNTFSSSINTRTGNLEVTSSALTSSLNALSASVYTTSGSVSSTVVSYGTRIGNLETTGSALSGSILSVSSSLYTTSGSLGTRIGNLETTGSALSGSILSVSSSLYTTSGSVSSTVVSYGTRIGTIESKYATTGSNTFSGNQTITGTITAQTLIVQTVTSSVVYSSGSNTFGNSSGNTQTMYGAVNIIGSVSASAYTGAGTGLTSIPNSALTNNSITVNGVSVALGGTLTQGQVLNGAISGSGQVAIASTSGFGTYINQALLTTSSPTFAAVSATTFTGALSGNATTATTAGALTSMNISQFTNNSGYITGITSANVTTALGYTPYNGATNPNGYITGVTNITGNAGTVTNATFYRQFTVRDDRSDGNDYSLSARATGLYAITSTGTNGPGSPYLSLIHVSNATDVAFQIAGGYTSDNMYFRGTSALQNGTGYTAWRTVIHSGNIGSQTVASAGNATTAGGLAVASGRNNSANQIVRTDGNGYIQAGYINSSNGNEGNNSSPSRVWGTNGSDDYLRTYLTSALSVNYASSAGSANSVSWGNVSSKPAAWLDATNLTGGNTPNTTLVSGFYNDYAGSGNPVGTWFSYVNVRHENPSNVYGHQHGMSFYDNDFWFRSYANGSYQSWAKALSTQNYSSYALPLSGGTMTGKIILGSFPNSTTNTGEAWIGRASDRNAGTMTVQLGGNSASSRYFEVVDYAWSVVLFSVSSGGTATASGDVVAYSDARVKTNIKPIDNSLEKVLKLTGVTYNRTDLEDKSTKIGFIAQEVKEVLPEVVIYNEEADKYGVSYGNVTALLVEAIKEQQTQIEELKTIINAFTK